MLLHSLAHAVLSLHSIERIKSRLAQVASDPHVHAIGGGVTTFVSQAKGNLAKLLSSLEELSKSLRDTAELQVSMVDHSTFMGELQTSITDVRSSLAALREVHRCVSHTKWPILLHRECIELGLIY